MVGYSQNKIFLAFMLIFAVVLTISFTIQGVVAVGEVCIEDDHCSSYGSDLFCDQETFTCQSIAASSEATTQSSTSFTDTASTSQTQELTTNGADDSTSSSSSSSSSSDNSYACLTTTDCEFYFGSGYECNLESYQCQEAIEVNLDTVEDNARAVTTLESDVDLLNSKLTGIESRLVSAETASTKNTASLGAVDSTVTSLEQSTAVLTTQVDTLNTNLQLISTDQNKLEREVEQEVNTLQAQVGNSIATLEQELDSAKGDLDQTKSQLESQAQKAKTYRTITAIAAVFAIFSAVTYVLMLHAKRHANLPKEAKDFITSQIKSGETKHQIISALKKSGWEESDAKWAYDHTKTENYNDYLISQGKEPKELPARNGASGHHQKALAISVISVLVLGVMLFFVKNSVGNAIYASGTSTQADLDESVELLLENYITQNSFYAAIDYVEGCVQVEDASYSSSWLVLKTPYGYSVTSNDPCEWDPTDYDFALKFTNYATFEAVTSSLTCTSASLAHQVVTGSTVTRGVYVLPSYFVDEGMTVQSGVDYSDFCTALSLCFSASDIQTLGITDCSTTS